MNFEEGTAGKLSPAALMNIQKWILRIIVFFIFQKKPLDLNSYTSKANIAHGVMDAALLAANVNQLRYILEAGPKISYYHFTLFLVIVSIVVQVRIDLSFFI